MPDLSKTFTLAEVEGLLAAERERAVALCEAIAASAKREAELLEPGAIRLAYQTRQVTAADIAAAIRSVPPKLAASGILTQRAETLCGSGFAE